MKDFKKIFYLMESIDPTYRNNLLNEISIIDKYNKEKDKNNYTSRGIGLDTFEELCKIDPTTKGNNVGKYCNWLIAKYNPSADFNELKRCLEWFVDGVKRNILSRYNISPDINSFKTYEELIETMNSLNDNNDDLNISSSEYNNRNKLEGQFEVLGSTSFYDIIAPKTFNAERYFGSNTEWCTVANNDYFSGYMGEGQLYILYPKNGDSEYKMQFHFESDSFANKYDYVVDNPIECIESVIEDEGVRNELIALCKKVFIENINYFLTFEEALEMILPKLENGTKPEELFDYVGKFKEGFATVALKYKWNFINTENKILRSDLWFDNVYDFNEGLAKVLIIDKGWNFIKTDRKILRDNLWFDEVNNFYKGFARVRIKSGSDYKDYKIDTNGILYDMYGDRVDIPVQESKKYNNNTNNINNMKKNVIKLTESDLHNIVKESVEKMIMKEAVLPDYEDHHDWDGDEEPFMYKGEDMFPDDVLYQAEKLNKFIGGRHKIQVTKDGAFIMPTNGSGSLSIESLQIIVKVTKYLRADRVYFGKDYVKWHANKNYDKSHKTQVGNKFFDKVPKNHQVTKPKVSHTTYKKQIPNYDQSEQRDFSGLSGWGG